MSSPFIASEERLSLSFSRGFALYRNGVAVVLACARAGQEISKDELLENTTLGTVQAEAMPRYAERCGLLDENRKPTLFGELAAQHDENLALPATQWLMHYYLAAPHRFAPNYWHRLAARFDNVAKFYPPTQRNSRSPRLRSKSPIKRPRSARRKRRRARSSVLTAAKMRSANSVFWKRKVQVPANISSPNRIQLARARSLAFWPITGTPTGARAAIFY